jgi:hypothetical protein
MDDAERAIHARDAHERDEVSMSFHRGWYILTAS